MIRSIAQLFSILALSLLVAACGEKREGPVQVAFIGDVEDLPQYGVRLSPAAQHVRAATAEGLVALDENDEIVPAIAERWIVTEDARNYIFRLRDSDWPDGTPLTGESVRDALRRQISALRGTSLGLDLAKIEEIRAMTGRVVEIRLSSPMPGFLRLLAQPELGLSRNGMGTGPMRLEGEPDSTITLVPLPPEERGLPEIEGWSETVRPVVVRSAPAREALAAFREGHVDAVLNGRLYHLPMVDTGPLALGTVRLDAARGLFGLRYRRATGFLADASGREALSMAIDRNTLMEPFSIGGWTPTTRLVPPSLAPSPFADSERWADMSLDQRRAEASRRVAAFGGDVRVVIALPQGPGSDRLFARIAEDLAAIGVTAVRSDGVMPVDLQLIDTLARFDSPRWYLNQFACVLARGPCSQEADALVEEALGFIDPAAQDVIIAEAAEHLEQEELYIPLGPPIRWSLIRGDLTGFTENAWGLHPLFPMAQRPI